MFFKKKDNGSIPPATAAAIVLAAVSLIVAAGMAKWTLFIANDLVMLRQDFNQLRSDQDQLKIQFDFWDKKVSDERAMLRKMREDMAPKDGMMPPQ